MLRAHLSVALVALVLGATPAATTADVGFSVHLSSDAFCCMDAGRGRATLILNNDLSVMSYDIDLHCLSSNFYSAPRIHAPVQPGQSPLTAPVVLLLVGTAWNDVDCQSSVCRPSLLCDRRGRAWGKSAVDPTIVNHIMNGVAWLSASTITNPQGEAWGPIGSDATPARSTTWGRVKVIYR